ncbi:MAG TPA: SNF2-related protein [Tepidisphaeraceae bacterium]|nr:SNF2-related protein [Tepidisphaeraceae bacterium]
MSFLQKIIDQVSVKARQGGVRCRSKGAVDFTQHDVQFIVAAVNCDGRHHVHLGNYQDAIEYVCDCKESQEDGDVCQHVWATLLAADSLGYLQDWDRRGRIELLPTDAFEDDEEGPDDDVEDDAEDDAEDIDEEDEDPYIVYDDEDPADEIQEAMRKLARTTPGKKHPPKKEDWKSGFETLRQVMAPKALPRTYGYKPWPPGRELLYIIDIASMAPATPLTIDLFARDLKKDGTFGKPRPETLSSEDGTRLPDPIDQEIIALLGGARADSYGFYSSSYSTRTARYRLQEAQNVMLLRRMCQSGRCLMRLKANDDDFSPLAWDDESHWKFVLKVERDEAGKQFVMHGELRSGEKRMDVTEPLRIVEGGVVFTLTHASQLTYGNAFQWVLLLRKKKKIVVPAAQAEELLEQLLTLPHVPELELPDDLHFERQIVPPRPRLVVKKPKEKPSNSFYYQPPKPKLVGELSFQYEGQSVDADDASTGVYLKEQRRLIQRDKEAERAAMSRLFALGFRQSKPSYYSNEPVHLELAPTHLANVVRALVSDNWMVEADGSLYRQAGNFNMEVSSGIDWFELHGTADFDGQSVGLPELLRAMRKGEKTVKLDDGTFGILPEQWLQKYGLLAGMGHEEEDHIRFGKAQVGLLDALLASQPEVNTDAVFEQARQRLREFSGVRSADPPASFVGTLRPYQREGLGWLEFLRRFGFGGCLADDMGLGKTVQVLALLEERRLLRAADNTPNANAPGDAAVPPSGNGDSSTVPASAAGVIATAAASPDNHQDANSGNGDGSAPATAALLERPSGPSLVVAPRSLVFNWREEALRFAPNLRVLDHTGIGRLKDAAGFANYDLILTTYGTMRNDIAFVKDVKFDYVVLDEAQAVKNANSESAKAARLLSGDHRLALSGTPVQNHLGELWSLFEFLNPGMLGAAKAFQTTGAGLKSVDETARVILSKALRPFILRRTKGQVAKELPLRVEQTIHCELDAIQRKLYDDLKEHYRRSLMSKIATDGLAKSKIQVLEALLRLRQAACHPGLLDKSRVDERSAKLDALMPQLAEVNDGGHKALVFSQFTSFLSIVRRRLDKDKVNYAYLDGRTRDRQAVVNQFQTDEKCRLFLISLKAGGVGLNLTAAEYVFLLDPWWNPAIEAQAIDRAHRIGQTRQVFAYRLIAKDTVEEKVLQLQATKRELADAIINADNSLIGKLGREDLELLLS